MPLPRFTFTECKTLCRKKLWMELRSDDFADLPATTGLDFQRAQREQPAMMAAAMSALISEIDVTAIDLNPPYTE